MVTETAPERDANGAEIPNSSRRCYVELELPPGMEEADKRSRDGIKRACRKAVYEEGLTEYGNKTLAVISHDDYFSVDYERVTVTKLLPPEKAERVRADNGKSIGMAPDEEEEPASYDDEDESDDEEDAS